MTGKICISLLILFSHIQFLKCGLVHVATQEDGQCILAEDSTFLLKLNGCGIKVLEPGIGQMRNLRVLELSDNKIENLPHELCSLKKLESLLLGGNRLHVLPHWICGIVRLHSLDLVGNPLESISPEIRKIKGLRWLRLPNGIVPGYFGFNRLGTLCLVSEIRTILRMRIERNVGLAADVSGSNGELMEQIFRHCMFAPKHWNCLGRAEDRLVSAERSFQEKYGLRLGEEAVEFVETVVPQKRKFRYHQGESIADRVVKRRRRKVSRGCRCRMN